MKLTLKRKISFALILGVFISTFGAPQGNAGLFGPSADTKKNIAAIKSLLKTEASLLNRYGAVTGKNYKDDYTTGMALIKLLPDVNNFIDKIDALSPKDSKLANGVSLWSKAWNKYAEGITINIAAIDAQDFSKMAQGNAAMSAARNLEKQAGTVLNPFLK